MIRTVCLPNNIGHMPLALFHGKIFNVPKDCNNGHGAGLESQKLLSKIKVLYHVSEEATFIMLVCRNLVCCRLQ